MTDARTINDDPRLPTLLQWREKLIDEGAVSQTAFKEAHVRLVLRSGRTDVEDIRGMLPGAVADHAGEMSQLLHDAPGAGTVEDGLASVDSVPQSGFARYTFGADDHEAVPVMLQRSRDTGALKVSWPPYAADQPCVIYRLVSSDGERAYSPDSAHLVQATAATAVTDARPLAEGARHLQVWANAGASTAEALEAQPVLYATGVVVGTLPDVELHEESGRVIGRWPAMPGISAVHIYRVPTELAERDGPMFRIAAQEQNLTGFVDYEAERGGRYLYRLRCEVEVDGVVRLSEAVEREIHIPAVCEPVTDLALNMHGPHDGAVFDLEWTTPRFGRVMVFRTPAPPNADAGSNDLDEIVLDQVGLERDLELTHPILERVDDRGVRKTVMAGVPWPEGWTRAYFTPVTILDGHGRLGKTISTVRTGVISDVGLVEYCNKQVLTFDWPTGAASVLVYITPKGHNPRQGMTGRSYEIALDDYEKYGGMRFVGNLPNSGCALHLVPAAFSGGRRVLGVPTSIEYGGLLRLWYDIEILRDDDGLPLTAKMNIRAEENVTGSPPFVLVNNPERLPLSVNDGIAVNVFRPASNDDPDPELCKEFQWSALNTQGGEIWAGDVRGMQGWIRLFANLPPDRLQLLALLDPPVHALRLTGGATAK
jgi:hypothetical protein